MFRKHTILISAMLLVITLLVVALTSCKSGGPTEGPPSDSLVKGEVTGLRKHSSGYLFDMDFTIESSSDIGTLPNPTKDRVGKTITAWTNENLKELEVGEDFTANVKLVYDASKTGTIFYVYNVEEE
jgi:predicted small lipoprotein YifL